MKYEINCSSCWSNDKIMERYPRLKELPIIIQHKEYKGRDTITLFIKINTIQDLENFIDCVDNKDIVISKEEKYIEIYDYYRE